MKEQYIVRLRQARDELLASLAPGELGLEILLPRQVKSETQFSNFTLFNFPVNVVLNPQTEFTPQALSVDITVINSEVQIEELNPPTLVESIGSYELGVNVTGKSTYTHKEGQELGGEIGGPGAKITSKLGQKQTLSHEGSVGTAAKETSQRYTSLIISSAYNGVARWKLLRAPQQPLLGSQRFAVTALLPSGLTSVTVEAHMQAELDHYGTYEMVIQKTVELPLAAP